MKCKFWWVIALAVIIECLMAGCASTPITQTNDLFKTLDKITNDYERRAEIITFINSVLRYEGKSFYQVLAHEYHGVRYSYDVNGKYLFVTEIAFGGSGSSYEDTGTYIFDTELLRLIPPESIFISTSDASFKKLVIEYLSRQKDFKMIDQNLLQNTIDDYGFGLFHAKNGIGIIWSKGTIAANAFGSYEIILPYSITQNYLTPIGKDIFK